MPRRRSQMVTARGGGGKSSPKLVNPGRRESAQQTPQEPGETPEHGMASYPSKTHQPEPAPQILYIPEQWVNYYIAREITSVFF